MVFDYKTPLNVDYGWAIDRHKGSFYIIIEFDIIGV